jgi:hypothetical protein
VRPQSLFTHAVVLSTRVSRAIMQDGGAVMTFDDSMRRVVILGMKSLYSSDLLKDVARMVRK